jgi:hypothetical protein
MPPMKCRKRRAFAAVLVGKDVLPRRGIHDRVVDMHRTARLALDRFGHEGGVAVVAERGLPDHPFEVEDLVGELDRVAVAEVQLDLARAAFVQDAVDLEPLRLGEIVDVVDDGAVFVHGAHGIGLPRGGPPARPAHGRFDPPRGVGVGRDEVELHLGCDDRLPALRLIERRTRLSTLRGA